MPGINNIIRPRNWLLIMVVAMVGNLLAACGSAVFKVENLAKGDIDFVADAHYRETQRLLKELTIKLYRRNPGELAKAHSKSIDSRVRQLFDQSGPVILAELDFKQGTDALTLALNGGFKGDRVLALIAGLNGMIRNSYEYRAESFMFDQLNGQKLYQSARNIEILLWQLKRRQASALGPLLLTNSLPGETTNLSYERLFGKIIALQDMMASIVAQQNDRLVTKVTQNIASMVFFPL